MPIYEYQAVNNKKSCSLCREIFEAIQSHKDQPITQCPECRQPVKKIISHCRSAIGSNSAETSPIEKQIKQYESSGMWSHAAELADKHSEKTADKGLKTRALDNYKKAGYDAKLLDKHSK
ncbi:MAG: zinc ribbon domain-containing protein [Desulfobacteraceae bacterium]|nr:MAG: zinc ribbon domain-containing protein [Desulfobacteraceae bacterium]